MLNLVFTVIRDLMPLKTMVQLKDLCLSCNEIDDVLPLQHMTQMTTLAFFGGK